MTHFLGLKALPNRIVGTIFDEKILITGPQKGFIGELSQ